MQRDLGNVHSSRVVPVGTKLWFKSEKQCYTVRASNAAFAILTKPFNISKTVLYTIIDWELGIRGPNNLIFDIGAATDEQCQKMLDMLTSGEIKVSLKRCVELDIIKAKIYEETEKE